MTSVAIAINGDASVATAGQGSRRAFRWAFDNLLPEADRFVLVHVIPTVTSVPTPSGDDIPIEQLDARAVAMYVQDIKAKSEEILIPFKKLCKTRKMEILVLEGENPASELLRYICEKRINSLVLGSRSVNCITRRMVGPTVPSLVLEQAPENCDIYVVHRDRLITTSLTYPSPAAESCCSCCFFTSPECGSRRLIKLRSASITDHTYLIQKSFTSHENSNVYSNDFDEYNRQDSSGAETQQSDVQDEVEKLRVELQNNISMYHQACEDLVHAQNKLQVLSSYCLEESEKVNNALKREKAYRKIAAKEKEKRLKAIKEIEEAKTELAKESYMRQIAELNAEKESLEKQKIVEKLFASDKRCRRYNKEEIEKATDNFSDSKKVGEGAFGKVYKCNLDHTPVAVKVLRSDSTERKEEFLKEVEVLSQLRHPNIVLLLGASPESGCLVYEYMENGSLGDHIYNTATKPLPWPVRFRILFQIACGLVFLHNSKPEPIIHRDIKPGNILLDRNFVSKIGDVGLAKLITDVVPDDVTEYRDSIIAGTLSYVDPEYLRTGTVRPKSDLYAFGIIILQMLSGRHPNGLLVKFENGIGSSSFRDLLDKSVSDWPAAETEELAELALECSKLRCRDRPDLETQVLPVLKKLADFAERCMKIEKCNNNAPSHFYCPITQEIMENPHIAPDGFSYEHRAIKLWVDRHNVSPVTKLKLQNKVLTPNHTLHSAIQEWKKSSETLNSN